MANESNIYKDTDESEFEVYLRVLKMKRSKQFLKKTDPSSMLHWCRSVKVNEIESQEIVPLRSPFNWKKADAQQVTVNI
jgi:hypothetical protein